MASYRHTFRCISCHGFVDYFNRCNDVIDVPSVFHGDLDQAANHGRPKSQRIIEDRLSQYSGRLLYHATEVIEPPVVVPAPVDQEWLDFEEEVGSAWRAFKNSKWDPAFRGPNFDGAYKVPRAVFARLRSAGGSIVIRGGFYTIASSNTTNASLHRQLDAQQGASGTYQSFVYHL